MKKFRTYGLNIFSQNIGEVNKINPYKNQTLHMETIWWPFEYLDSTVLISGSEVSTKRRNQEHKQTYIHPTSPTEHPRSSASMASTLRSSPIPLILFLQLCFLFLSTTLAISSGYVSASILSS